MDLDSNNCFILPLETFSKVPDGIIYIIPLEVWTHICSFSKNLDLTNLLKTCKFFKQIFFKKYKLYLHHSFSLSFVHNYSSYLRYLKATHLFIYPDTIRLTSFSDNLKKLIIRDNLSVIIDKNFWKLNLNFLPFISLTIEKYYSDYIFIPPFVTKLNLKDYLGTEIYLENYLSLKELKISGKKKFFLTLPESLEKLSCIKLNLDYNSDYNLECPVLNDNLKSLYLERMILPEKLPDDLQELTINESKLIHLKSFGLIFKLIVKELYCGKYHNNFDEIIYLQKLLNSNTTLKELEIASHFIDKSNFVDGSTYISESLWLNEEIIHHEINLPKTLEKLTIEIIYPNFNLSYFILPLENLKELKLTFQQSHFFNKSILVSNVQKLISETNFKIIEESNNYLILKRWRFYLNKISILFNKIKQKLFFQIEINLTIFKKINYNGAIYESSLRNFF